MKIEEKQEKSDFNRKSIPLGQPVRNSPETVPLVRKHVSRLLISREASKYQSGMNFGEAKIKTVKSV